MENHPEKDGFGPRMRQQIGALPEVIDDEGDKNSRPRLSYGFCAKVSHVRIERFPSCCAEDDLSERDKASHTVSYEELQSVIGVNRHKDPGSFPQRPDPRKEEGAEPYDHDRPERTRDPSGPFALEREEHDGDDHGNEHDRLLRQMRQARNEYGPFDCAQYADSRGDYSVAHEE